MSTCKDCRYAGTHKRPRVLEETGFGDQLMFADADEGGVVGGGDETVYTCRAYEYEQGVQVEIGPFSGKEVGLVPVACAAWKSARSVTSARLAELDAMIAAREARARRGGDE